MIHYLSWFFILKATYSPPEMKNFRTNFKSLSLVKCNECSWNKRDFECKLFTTKGLLSGISELASFHPLRNNHNQTSRDIFKLECSMRFQMNLSFRLFWHHISFIHSPLAGLGSLVGCALDWWSGGRLFAAPVRQHSFVEIDHEIFSTVILSLPLIQEGKLSVTCERMCTEYWLTA